MRTFKLFAISIAILMLTSNVFSQGKSKANKGWDGTKPEVLKGSASLVFFYAPFVSGSLGSANAGSYSKYIDSTDNEIKNLAGIGLQYYFTDKLAVVLGISSSIYKSESKDLSTTLIKNSTFQWGISGDLNYHLTSLYSVSPYVGVNLNLGLLSSSSETTFQGSLRKEEIDWNGLIFSGGLNVGFDWYFTPGLSLGGKYTLRTSLISSPEKETKSTSSTGVVTTTMLKGPSEFRWESGISSIVLNVHF